MGKDSNKKTRARKGFIIGAVLFLILLFVGIGIPCIYTQNQKRVEKQRINEELDDQTNQTSLFGKKSVKYSKEKLDEIVGVELRESEEEMCGYSCMEYWNNRNTPTKFDDLRFYVFENQKAAKKVLKKIKQNSFREITDEGDGFVSSHGGLVSRRLAKLERRVAQTVAEWEQGRRVFYLFTFFLFYF